LGFINSGSSPRGAPFGGFLPPAQIMFPPPLHKHPSLGGRRVLLPPPLLSGGGPSLGVWGGLSPPPSATLWPPPFGLPPEESFWLPSRGNSAAYSPRGRGKKAPRCEKGLLPGPLSSLIFPAYGPLPQGFPRGGKDPSFLPPPFPGWAPTNRGPVIPPPLISTFPPPGFPPGTRVPPPRKRETIGMAHPLPPRPIGTGKHPPKKGRPVGNVAPPLFRKPLETPSPPPRLKTTGGQPWVEKRAPKRRALGRSRRPALVTGQATYADDLGPGDPPKKTWHPRSIFGPRPRPPLMAPDQSFRPFNSDRVKQGVLWGTPGLPVGKPWTPDQTGPPLNSGHTNPKKPFRSVSIPNLPTRPIPAPKGNLITGPGKFPEGRMSTRGHQAFLGPKGLQPRPTTPFTPVGLGTVGPANRQVPKNPNFPRPERSTSNAHPRPAHRKRTQQRLFPRLHLHRR